jgi:hypothetical protein
LGTNINLIRDTYLLHILPPHINFFLMGANWEPISILYLTHVSSTSTLHTFFYGCKFGTNINIIRDMCQLHILPPIIKLFFYGCKLGTNINRLIFFSWVQIGDQYQQHT